MFRTSRPVTAEAFHDRSDNLSRLRTTVQQLRDGEPAWIAIIGPRKVGKTSLILELQRSTANDVAFVVLDAETQRPLSSELFRTLALRAADTLLRRFLPASLEVAAATTDDYLDLLLVEGVRDLPQDALRVLRALPSHRMDPAFLRLCIDLPERLAQALDTHVVVAIDEFQELASLRANPDPLSSLRNAWQRHKRVSYFVSGSGRTLLEDMVSREHSPFFQHFSIMHLDRFDTQDAIDLLTTSCPPERPISKEIAAQAVRVVGAHPFYVQLLGEELVRRPPPYDRRALQESVQELLFTRSGRLALYFQNVFDRVVGNSSFLAATLSALAQGPRRVTDLAQAIGIRTGDTARYLERLGDAIVKQPDGLYRVEDSTFASWLAWRRPGGTVVPMTLVGDEAEKDVAHALAKMGFELVYQSRASRGSFDLLALRGPEQLGVQVKRSPLPLRFEKTAWNRMQADAKRFGWQWVVAAVADHNVVFCDPAKAKRGKELRLTEAAILENLPAWLQAK